MAHIDILTHQSEFDAQLLAWEDDLAYVREKVDEWKASGDAEDRLYPLRAYLLKTLREHMTFEMEVRAAFSLRVPPSDNVPCRSSQPLRVRTNASTTKCPTRRSRRSTCSWIA